MRIDVVDIYHGDDPVSFHAFQDAGAKGVILKATTGRTGIDPKFEDYYKRAVSVFGEGCVHSYHWLTGDDASSQMSHYLSVTDGKPGRWLDYEDHSCSLETAVDACHIISQKINRWVGMYGSDGDLLGRALLGGHFTVCPLWIARYGPKPLHECSLWQYASGESNTVQINGRGFDVNAYMGSGDVADWMKSLTKS